jgi:hypothetical protein
VIELEFGHTLVPGHDVRDNVPITRPTPGRLRYSADDQHGCQAVRHIFSPP